MSNEFHSLHPVIIIFQHSIHSCIHLCYIGRIVKITARFKSGSNAPVLVGQPEYISDGQLQCSDKSRVVSCQFSRISSASRLLFTSVLDVVSLEASLRNVGCLPEKISFSPWFAGLTARWLSRMSVRTFSNCMHHFLTFCTLLHHLTPLSVGSLFQWRKYISPI